MQYSGISDQTLIKNYINGNERSFEVLLERHRNKVYTHVYLMVRDKDLSEDIFQDTFIKVINTLKRGKYNEEGKFLPWVIRIAHNLVIDHFRKAKKMPKVREDDDYSPFATIEQEDPNIQEEMITDQIHSDLKHLVELLPDEQKEIIMLRHYMGMSFKDIAERTNVSINTALGRMRYALINLRKMVEEKEVILHRS
ncbi:MAG: sigma-70 family RNA polymerase sigma factor [Flavobacteriales bacterium]|nr:sigma-70 family RNA polymerase sigma factor [Flavobacteriales bacterium]